MTVAKLDKTIMNQRVENHVSVLLLVATLLLTAGMPNTATAQANEPFLGQLTLVGFNYCPRGWADADGQLLPISQYNALFALFGTIYGGDGRTTFALPDLRGRAPIHEGRGPGLQPYTIGERGGAESLTVTEDSMPMHSHDVNATNVLADKPGPGGKLLAADSLTYTLPPVPENNKRVMDPSMIGFTGNGEPIQKRSPYLAMKWCVALQGIFPSRN